MLWLMFAKYESNLKMIPKCTPNFWLFWKTSKKKGKYSLFRCSCWDVCSWTEHHVWAQNLSWFSRVTVQEVVNQVCELFKGHETLLQVYFFSKEFLLLVTNCSCLLKACSSSSLWGGLCLPLVILCLSPSCNSSFRYNLLTWVDRVSTSSCPLLTKSNFFQEDKFQ